MTNFFTQDIKRISSIIKDNILQAIYQSVFQLIDASSSQKLVDYLTFKDSSIRQKCHKILAKTPFLLKKQAMNSPCPV
jgi:hypothetical protein